MRLISRGALPLAALLLLGVPRAQAQISAHIRIGPEVVVLDYSPDRYGEWRSAYREWIPVTLYYRDGRYYQGAVRGARRVVVYRWHDQYFLPPHDRAWIRADRRYDYRHRPRDDDYHRARRPRPPQ